MIPSMERHTNFLVIINPVSGKRKNELLVSGIKKAFPDCKIMITRHKGHPFEIAQSEDLTKVSAIIAVGGDGTMHEVINGMMARKDGIKLPIGLIPGGTGNSFMHDLDCLDPLKAINIIEKGKLKKIDLMKVNMPDKTCYAYNIVGWGISVTINNLAEKWRRVGGQRYNLAALYEIIQNRKWPVKITLDNEVVEGSFSFFLACNTMYSGNGMKVAPKAILDDGLIDVLILKQAPRHKLIGLFSKIFSGNHIHSPLMEYRHVRSFSIYPKKNSVLNIDGLVAGSTPIHASVLPKVIEVFYPA